MRHRWEDWTVAAAEDIWMHRKVYYHDRKSASRNDGQRQEWRGGLGYIYYTFNKTLFDTEHIPMNIFINLIHCTQT